MDHIIIVAMEEADMPYKQKYYPSGKPKLLVVKSFS